MESGWQVKTDLKTGILHFSFSGNNGTPAAEFSVNPADIRLAEKMNAVAEEFAEMKMPENVAKYDKALEDKICYILGENQRKLLFSNISATTVLPGGSMFASEIIMQIHDAVIQELKQRHEKLAQAVARHTAKYK